MGRRADLDGAGHAVPGPGTIYVDQTLHFSRPVRVGDTLTVTVTCQRKFDHNHHMLLDCLCTNQDGHKVIAGTAEVLAPTEKIKRRKAELPEFRLAESGSQRYQHLLATSARACPPFRWRWCIRSMRSR